MTKATQEELLHYPNGVLIGFDCVATYPNGCQEFERVRAVKSDDPELKGISYLPERLHISARAARFEIARVRYGATARLYRVVVPAEQARAMGYSC